MGKRRNEAFDKAKGIEKKIVIKKEGELIEPATRVESMKAQHVTRKFIRKVIENSVNKIGIENIIKSSYIFSITKEDMTDIVYDGIKRVNDSRIKSKDIKNYLESDLSVDDQIKYSLYLVKNTPNAEHLRDRFVAKIVETAELDSIEKLDGIIEKIAFNVNADVDDLIPDDTVFENPIDNGLKDEVNKVSAEIDALKTEYKDDREFNELLDKAYSYTTTGNSITVAMQSDIAETIGKDSLALETRDATKYLKENKYDLTDFDIRDRSIVFGANVNSETIAEYTRGSAITFPKLSDDTKAKLLRIEEFIKENGYEDKIIEFGNYDILTDAKKALQDAIASKNKEEIIKATSKYEKINEAYKDVLKLCNDITPENRFPNNLSAGRVSTVPFEYRNDVKGSSFLRAFTGFLNDCREANVSLDAYLDNPAIGNKMVVDDFTNKIDEKYSVTNLEVVEATNKLCENAMKAYVEENGKFASIGHGFVVLSSAVTGEASAEMRSKMNMLQRGYNDKRIYSMNNFVANGKSMANFIAVEKEDRIARNLDDSLINYDNDYEVKKFDLKDYILSGKTSTSAVASRIVDMLAAIPGDDDKGLTLNTLVGSKVVNEACRINANTILKTKELQVSETAKKVLKQVSKGKLSKITSTDNKILKSEMLLNAQIAKGTIKDAPNACIKSLAELKSKYEGRNPLLKIFGFETRRLSRAIDAITSKITEAGVSVETLNEKLDLARRGELADDIVKEEAVQPKINLEVNADKKPVVLDLDEEIVKEPIEVKETIDLDADLEINNSK